MRNITIGFMILGLAGLGACNGIEEPKDEGVVIHQDPEEDENWGGDVCSTPGDGTNYDLECSNYCWPSRLGCFLSGFGTRCYIASCTWDGGNCPTDCTGTCGWTDQTHPDGCRP